MLIRPNHVSCWRAGLFAGLCSIIALYIFFARGHISTLQPFLSAGSAFSADYQTNLIPYWKELASSLEAARPVCPPINVTTEEMPNEDRNFEPLKKKERPERLFLPAEDEAELMRAHRSMRVAARRLAPLLPVGDETGIVTTGGLKLFPVLLVSLRMLRRTGCTLPVQVFLGDQKEYEEVKSTCEDVLPSLNAKCHVVEDVYSTADVAIAPPEHFQFKILAILFSSFRHVLFLDADAFPVHDPTPLFNSPPYTTHGLVTWPGFFANTASPHYYHIAGIAVPPPNRGTESGQLLLDKKHHAESIPMMVYYNYFGPDYYYPLQSQNGPGQGDKETFSAAAVAVNAPFYGVKTPVSALGNHVNGQYIFAGAGQADPMQDYLYDPPYPNHIQPEYERNEEKNQVRAFFVHTVSPETKLNPLKLLREGGVAWDANGDWHRIWGKEKNVVEKFGYDVEKRMWECVEEEACRTDQDVCMEVKAFYAKVFGTMPAK
ncbi:hypothetical protein AA0113_g6210 [Alternaria arborescens]|uniref:Alpha-1,2-mannosyltransferase n=1 Tax=Alternaria arborescens TaxID=156630 RepID=A0A4V1X5J7_9PLEO|nr:hypothetical protein AA0112_g7496 [Alternaria arborescens]RYO63228.1 hypothetical protein AA0113_g6210 [Alternaria arborescens]